MHSKNSGVIFPSKAERSAFSPTRLIVGDKFLLNISFKIFTEQLPKDRLLIGISK
jgi:hypothetical protein